jgi:hypothetical protein
VRSLAAVRVPRRAIGRSAGLATAALALLLPLAACGAAPSSDPAAASGPVTTPAVEVTAGATLEPPEGKDRKKDRKGSEGPSDLPTLPPEEEVGSGAPMVLAISVDGLGSTQVLRRGPSGMPELHDLFTDGAATLHARTEVELTVTLPNHTGMLTGRRVEAAKGGHGWTVNFDNGRRVLLPSGEPVPSVFDVVHSAGLTSALFATKDKFIVFDRTWPSIDEYVYVGDNRALVDRAVQTLRLTRPDLTFLHLSAPDDAGHGHGWGTPGYDRALDLVDAQVGRLRSVIERHPYLRKHLVIVLTADHGGTGREHGTNSDPRNYQVPFVVAGPGVDAGVDLYDLNPQRADPLESWPSYDVRPGPIRNGDVANLALSLLGLDPVPGSEFGVDDPIRVRADR